MTIDAELSDELFHIGWPHLPELSTRLYAARAVLSLPSAISSYANDGEANRVIDSVSPLIAGQRASDDEYRTPAPDEPDDFAPLQDHFVRVAEELDKREGHRAQRSSKAKEVLLALESALSDEPCRHCCRPSNAKLCKWTEKTSELDKETLRAIGRCLAPATDMFNFALSVAADAYEPFVIDGADLVAVHLRTGRVTHRITDIDSAVGGETTQSEISGVVNRFVLAKFWEQEFGNDDFMTLLYVFMHECVAHAYCGVPVDFAGFTASTAFHEGWMDEVAAAILEDALNSGLSVGDSTSKPYGLQFLHEMQRTRSSRRRSKRPGAAIDASIWAEGMDAFATVRRAFEDILARQEVANPAAMATAKIIELSLALNISDVSHSRRGDFVSRIGEHYVRDGVALQARAREARPDLDMGIERYLEDGDAVEFLDWVVAIPVDV